jgi:phospholipase C
MTTDPTTQTTGPSPEAGGEGAAASAAGLQAIEHIVVLMLENRSLDHMLGYLYRDSGNVSPLGQPFDGLTGKESNPQTGGAAAAVFPIEPGTPNAYFMPGADPGEGYLATNSQVFGSTAPAAGAPAAMAGFVNDYAYTLGWEAKEKWSIVAGTTAGDIMGCFTPEALPVLSGLARGFAVCDAWFGSAPTETLPNRAFAITGTSQGHMDDKTRTFTAPSIFGSLTAAGVSWAVYGYNAPPLSRQTYTDITNAPDANFGLFADFRKAAAAGTLPGFAFLEPSWEATGNSQHPNYDVALGEQLIHDVYYALRGGPAWASTLLILTYDEHGGCYDHVAPPANATPPDSTAGEYGFDFARFGPRVPTVLVSPLIPAGTVFRVPQGATPLDHTSILKTVEERWGLKALTKRDAAAQGVGAALSLTAARTDDPLAGVVVPVSGGTVPGADKVSHLQEVHADLLSRFLPAGVSQEALIPAQRSRTDAAEFIRHSPPVLEQGEAGS